MIGNSHETEKYKVSPIFLSKNKTQERRQRITGKQKSELKHITEDIIECNTTNEVQNYQKFPNLEKNKWELPT